MSTDEYSQDLPDEDVYGMQGTSSMSYHNGSSMMMPGNMDMSMLSGSQQQMGQQQQQHDQRQVNSINMFFINFHLCTLFSKHMSTFFPGNHWRAEQ